MNSEEKKKSIQETILKKIERGETTMKSKSYFVIRAILLLAGVVIVALALFFFMSFILFTLRQTGLLLVPIFGFQGIRIVMASFPWIFLLLILISIILLELLIKKYTFAYRRPLVYSLVAIMLFTSIGGFVVAQTSFHDEFYKRAQNNHLPFMGPLYHSFGLERLDDVHRGIITVITENGFQMENLHGEILTIIIFDETRFPLGTNFKEGDSILVLGRQDNGTIQAFGIRKIGDKSLRKRLMRGNNGETSSFFKERLHSLKAG